jgi:hypothetical protein
MSGLLVLIKYGRSVSQGEKSANESEAEFKRLNFGGCRFPSDGLTIATLRFMYRDLFDVGFDTSEEAQPQYFLQPRDNNFEPVGEMLFCERCVATFAYAKARGIDVPTKLDLESYKDELVDYYRQFGLASGIKQASELVREVERQGQQLALEQGPRVRGGR